MEGKGEKGLLRKSWGEEKGKGRTLVLNKGTKEGGEEMRQPLLSNQGAYIFRLWFHLEKTRENKLRGKRKTSPIPGGCLTSTHRSGNFYLFANAGGGRRGKGSFSLREKKDNDSKEKDGVQI